MLGEALWFKSAERELEPAAEAFGSALLLPALGAPRRLRLEAPVSPVWMANMEGVLAVAEEWWGYPRLLPSAPRASSLMPQHDGTGLFFSGGVDSLHMLLTARERPDALIFVLGFDLALDSATAEVAERSAREVAAAAGVELIAVRTNLRTHPAHGQTNWERSHGGALAAVGHALSSCLGRVLVSATYPRFCDYPWGSHFRLDPLWSSERLEVVHVGDELWRSDKLTAIADEPLAQRHLRVCWERSLPGRLNCSRCEKCVRTMIPLSESGLLDRFEVFDPPAPIHELVADLPSVPLAHVDLYKHMRSSTGDRRLRRALRRLLARST